MKKLKTAPSSGAARRLTIYLPATAAADLDEIRATMVSRYSVGITVSAVMARLLEEGKAGILERPFAPELRRIETRIEELWKELADLDGTRDPRSVNRLHRQTAELFGQVRMVSNRLSPRSIDSECARLESRLHELADACGRATTKAARS